MEDFLYILLLVAWVVFSIYKKSSKKKQQTAPGNSLQGKSQESAPQKPRSILEQILLGTEPEPVIYEEDSDLQFNDNHDDDEVNEDKYKGISDAEIAAKYDFDPSKEGLSSGESYEEVVDLPEVDDSEKGIDFNLRQAVIFSEILKRPYAN